MNNRNRIKRIAAATAAGAAAMALTGCQYLARQDLIEPYSGDAPARNIALQMQDPWPPYVYDTRIPTRGRRQADAIVRHDTAHEKAKPQDVAPIQLVVPQTN